MLLQSSRLSPFKQFNIERSKKRHLFKKQTGRTGSSIDFAKRKVSCNFTQLVCICRAGGLRARIIAQKV